MAEKLVALTPALHNLERDAVTSTRRVRWDRQPAREAITVCPGAVPRGSRWPRAGMWCAGRARLKPRLGLAPLKRGIAPHGVRAGLPARGRAASSLAHKPRGDAPGFTVTKTGMWCARSPAARCGWLTPGASPGFTVTKTWHVVRAACAAQAAARPRPAEAGYRTAPGHG